MTIDLRPYQQQMQDETAAAYDADYRYVLNQLSTGGGKTWLLAAQVAETDGPTCTIAHRQELLSQISTTYAKAGIRHAITAPQPVVNGIIESHVAEVGRSFVDPRSQTVVAGVDTLVRRFKPGDRWCRSVVKWLMDECFVAGTLIDNTPIEQVKVGDMVTAFDETSGGLVRRRVTHTFKNKMPQNMVRLATCRHTLYATPGHPFWTQRGWVVAKDLQENDFVAADSLHMVRGVGEADRRASEIPLAENRSNFLQSVVRSFSQRCEPEEGIENAPDVRHGGPKDTATLPREGQDSRLDCDVVPCLRRTGRKPAVASKKVGQGVLQQKMQQCLCGGDFVRTNGEDQQRTCIGTNETEQPNAQRWSSRENERDAAENRTQAEHQGRQRFPSDKGRNEIARFVQALGFCQSTCCHDRVAQGSEQPKPLQDRLCEFRPKNCDRSGWTESFFPEATGLRRQKRQVLEWQRVESVSVLKRGNSDIPGDGFVYNIEVDGVHTYTANGIVTHNCHHCLSDNKWGRAAALFPNALGYGVTATPIRADRRSLHIDQGGAFDYLVQGASMRDLIEMGSLVDYRVIAPQSSIDEAMLRIGSTGDFTAASQREATRAELFGDVVRTYLDRVPGKRAIVFTTGVEASRELADRFTEANVRAKALNGNTDDGTRTRAVRAFGRGELDVLINTGLFDEGFDVPAVEVTIMARPTMSFGLFCQQIGRCLRPAPNKTHGIVIDHVGNVLRMAATHGMPDTPRRWSLWKYKGQRGVPKNPDAIPMRTCICGLAYPALTMVCPFCGVAHEPAGRSEPAQVDGILAEMSPELLERLRMARAQVERDKPAVPAGAEPMIVRRLENLHRDRQAAHRSLAEAMEQWGGVRRAAGDDDTTMQARFLHRFGYDVLTAQGLKTADALRLRDEIMEAMEWANDTIT